jgi:hypothetical protein
VFTIDFTDVSVDTPPGYTDYSLTGLHLHDVDFSANPNTEGGLVVYSQNSAYTYRASFSGNLLVGNTWQTKNFTANLPANVSALSMLVLTETYGGRVTFTFSTGAGDTRTVITTADTTPDFIGFVSDQPIQWVTLDSTDRNFVALDDFSYGEAATPEANTILLGGLGLAALWISRRMGRVQLRSSGRG